MRRVFYAILAALGIMLIGGIIVGGYVVSDVLSAEKPIVEKKNIGWKTITSLSGIEDKMSDTFSAKAPWKIVWNWDNEYNDISAGFIGAVCYGTPDLNRSDLWCGGGFEYGKFGAKRSGEHLFELDCIGCFIDIQSVRSQYNILVLESNI